MVGNNILFLLFLFGFSFHKSDVYFTKNISSSTIVELYKKLNINLPGKIGLKIHTGEAKGPYFLRPSFLKDIYDYTGGTYIETNTAYNGSRGTTEKHMETLKINGWSDYRVVIMDQNPKEDFVLNISNYKMISKNYVGSKLKDFNSCIVLSHFKGHSVGGFGGALKQLSIGFASKFGKSWIHTAGNPGNGSANSDNFTAAMGDAAASIVNFFKHTQKGNIVFINTMVNISIRCDCAGEKAPAPEIKDIGTLASTDPVALDRACLDLIKKNIDKGTDKWLSQLEKLKGENTIFVAEQNGIGTQDYNLIDLDIENDKNKKNGNTFLFIAIGVGCFLALCVSAGVIYYVRKKMKNFDENIIDNLNNTEENKQILNE